VAAVQDSHAVRQPSGLAQEVGAEHHRAPLLGGQPGDEADHLAGGGGVQARGGLVQEEDLGVVQQGAGQGHPLALAGGEAVDPDVGQFGHGELLEDLGRPVLGLVAGHPPDAGGEDEVLPGGQAIVQAGVLGEHTGPSAHGVTVDRGIQAQDRGPPRVGGQHSVEEADGRGLARPVGPEQRQDLARGDIEGQVVDGPLGPEGLGQALGPDGRVDPRVDRRGEQHPVPSERGPVPLRSTGRAD